MLVIGILILTVVSVKLETNFDNLLSCPYGQACVILDECHRVTSLMFRDELPAQRFKQSVCGYYKEQTMICCEYDEYLTSGNRNYPIINNKNEQCGKSLVRSDVMTIGTYPFLARIGFLNVATGIVKYPCTGTIVDNRTILTTATCALAISANHKLHSVLIGEYDSKNDPDCNELFCGHNVCNYDISYIIKHPNFNPESYNNNLALLRLKSTIDFTVTAQPICLLSDKHFLRSECNLTFVGWGKMSNERVESTKQRHQAMRILPNEFCQRYSSCGLSVDMCVKGTFEPCSAYSGSPIFIKNMDTYYLAGILSYGSKCNENSNSPSVFVDISRYINWIKLNS